MASLFLVAPQAAPHVAAAAAPKAAAAVLPASAAPALALPLPEMQLTRPVDTTLIAAVTSLAGVAAAAPQIGLTSAAPALAGLGGAAGICFVVPLVGFLGKQALGAATSNQGEKEAVAVQRAGGQRSGAPIMSAGASKSRAATPRMVAGLAKAGKASKVASKEPEFCYGLPGAIAPAGQFDPANLLEGKSEADVLRLREAELTHGRVGMLASLGFLVQENFHPLFTADGGPAIEQIPQLPPWIWFIMTLGIGIAEGARIQKGWANPYEGMGNVQSLKPGYTPGDLDFDPLGLKPEDPAEFRVMQEKELSHGRLAMLAAAGFLAQETVTGTTWGQTDISFENLLLGAELSKIAAAQ